MEIVLDLTFLPYSATISEGVKASQDFNLGAHQDEVVDDERPDSGYHSDNDDEHPVEEIQENLEGDFEKFTGRKRKLWELRQKMVRFFLELLTRLKFD